MDLNIAYTDSTDFETLDRISQQIKAVEFRLDEDFNRFWKTMEELYVN
jgi:hypothetical protein